MSLTVRQTASGQYPVSSTDTANTVPGVQNTISSVQLAPHTFQSKTWLARNEEEDTLLPLMDFLVDGATNRLQRAFEKGLIRGDGSITTTSNTPSDYASVINGFVSLSESVAGDGLKVFTGANATQASAINIATARALMGKYGMIDPSQLVYITTIEGINELIQTADFRTVDTFGPKATYHTGVLGAVWGIPVITSEFMDVKGASTTSNQAVGVLVNKNGFVVGNKRPLIIETEYKPDTQVTDIHISMRADMKALTTVASSALSNSYSFATVIHTGDGSI